MEELRDLLKKFEVGVRIQLIVGALVVISACAGAMFVAAKPTGAIFGKSIKGIESRLLSEKRLIVNYQIKTGLERKLQVTSIRYLDASIWLVRVFCSAVEVFFLFSVLWMGLLLFLFASANRSFIRKVRRYI